VSLVEGAAYARPATLVDALATRAAHPNWVVLAGGTDLMVPGHPGASASGVLDLCGLDELHGIEATGDLVRIGACTTYAELLASELVSRHLSLLAVAAREVGATQIRSRGTVGGNVMTASPVGDLLPVLLALDATVMVASATSHRCLPYERFVTGYRSVDLAAEELLTAVELAVPAPGTQQHWRKVGPRAAQAISKVSLAATGLVVDGRVEHVRLAFGGVADRPVRLHAVESLVQGAPLGPALAEQVRDAVAGALDPITDMRSTADYRRDVAANLAARFVTTLAGP
jgi:CO/xanthine dehydrogenase FAD-binding subunit